MLEKISVIMPAYNVGKYIDKAIASVVDQEHQDFELIVINDGSDDNTGTIAENYARQDERIVVIHQDNSGKPSIARNVGLRTATGGLVSYLDGDDIYLPGRLSNIAELFETFPDVDIALNDMKRLSTDGQLQDGTYLHEFNFPGNAKDYVDQMGQDSPAYRCADDFYNFISAIFCPVLMPTITIRRNVLSQEKSYFREDLRCGEDIDLWFRLIYRTTNVIYLDEALCAYRYHETSTTQEKEDFYLGTITSHLANLKRGKKRLTLSEKKRYIRRIADRYTHLAYWYFTHGHPREARKAYFKALMLRPTLTVVPNYLKTFVPERVIDMYRRRG